MLEGLGASTVAVKTPAALEGLDAIVLPGGESTTISLLLRSAQLERPLFEAIRGGMACLGTCAGLVLLASTVLDGREDQVPLGLLDVTVRRNGYGRQLQSFEAKCSGLGPLSGDSIAAAFIRAPVIEALGDGVEVLATLDAEVPHPVVLVRHGKVLAGTFHPELMGEDRVHRYLLELCG